MFSTMKSQVNFYPLQLLPIKQVLYCPLHPITYTHTLIPSSDQIPGSVFVKSRNSTNSALPSKWDKLKESTKSPFSFKDKHGQTGVLDPEHFLRDMLSGMLNAK